MIRGETLRTKTAQVAAEHHRETSQLGALREREVNARDRMQSREERFWREVKHASAARSDRRRAHGGDPAGSVARALEAHRLFKKAKEEHTGVTGEVRHQVAKVLKAKVALDAFSKLQRRERTQREYRTAERLGEEIGELQVSHRIRQCRGMRRREVTACDESSERAADIKLTSSGVQPLAPNAREGQGAISQLALVPVKPVDVPLRVNESTILQAVHADISPHRSTLQVQIESSGTPVACRLAATGSGEVGVIVEAPRGPLLQRLERERAGLASKLTELGIKLSRLEVRRESGVGHSDRGLLRRGRRTQEERDENTIA